MRWIVPLGTNDLTAQPPQQFEKEVLGPEGLCVNRLRCDGAGEFQGRFVNQAKSLGIRIERLFGTVIGIARSLTMEAPRLPGQLWAEAAKIAGLKCNRTPSSLLDGKNPLYIWKEKPLESLEHIHEEGCVGFKHIKKRERECKVAPRAKRYFLVGINMLNRTWRLWQTLLIHRESRSRIEHFFARDPPVIFLS